MSGYTTKPYKARDHVNEVVAALGKVADIVSSTMGPGGRNVIIDSANGMISTKDGVTVATYQRFEDRFENMLAKMAIDAASKTVKEVGDGTTTSTLLLHAVYKELMEIDSVRNAKVNLFHVAEGLEKGVEIVRECLMSMAKEIVVDGQIDREALRDVAVISANNDEILGRMIANLVADVGVDGVIDVKESTDGTTYSEKVTGYIFPTMPLQGFFKEGAAEIVYKNPVVLLMDVKLADYDQIADIMRVWQDQCRDENGKLRPLVIVASDIEGSAMTTLVNNSKRFPVVVVKAPNFGEQRMDLLEDMQHITGTRQVFSTMRGRPLDRFGLDLEGDEFREFGECKEFVLKRDRAIIVPHGFVERMEKLNMGPTEEQKKNVLEGRAKLYGNGSIIWETITMEESVGRLVNNLKFRMEKMEESGMKEFLKQRISRLQGGVGTIYVGANSQIEMNFKKMVIDDAQRACFTALDGGVVPGSGVSLLHCTSALEAEIEKYSSSGGDRQKAWARGLTALVEAIRYPFVKILSNYHIDLSKIADLIEDIEAANNEWYGYNLMEDESCDMMEMGIIDPVKVEVSAVKNAVSVASKLMVTEWFLMLEEENDAKDMIGKIFYPER